VSAADLDGDGDMDALSASFWPDRITWYENTDGRDSFHFKSVIATERGQSVVTAEAGWTKAVYATDVDQDGDMDVVAASSSYEESVGESKIAWYENTDGKGTFASPDTIARTQDGVLWIYVADVDGDGDVDVFIASSDDGAVAWYENLSSRA
jgi:hypothetical protein